MAVLGIESTAHTFGVGVCSGGMVLANQKSMYPIRDKGLIPAKVADFHARKLGGVIRRALREAGTGMDGIDAIGYTKGPGLGPCLSVGQLAAKSLAGLHGIPLFPVNHAIGHIEVVRQAAGVRDPLVLYVSGGNSQILGISDTPYRHYMVHGETFDIGVGNMLDSFARAAGMNPAWGSTVAMAAKGGRYVEMPYTVKGMDFTFTGLLTHASKMLGSCRLADVAYSLQETSFSMLCEATERALLLTKKRELIACGGVAQSSRLREMLGMMAGEHGAEFFAAGNELNADNGAMIAMAAEKMLNTGRRYSMEECTIDQRYRVDRVRLTW